MQVTGLVCVQCVCTFHIWLHHFAAANHGQLSSHFVPLMFWCHVRSLERNSPPQWSMLLWCDFWSVSWWVLHRACRNQWFGSSSLGNRMWFCGLHHLCVLPCTSFHWGFRLKQVPTGPSGCALCVLLHEFLIPSGRVAKPLWPWHMTCRIQALTQGQAGYWLCGLLQSHTW